MRSMNIESTKYLDKTYSIIIFAEMYVRMSAATFFLPFLIANTIAALVQYTNASSKSPYESEYDHVCDDAEISDPDDHFFPSGNFYFPKVLCNTYRIP